MGNQGSWKNGGNKFSIGVSGSVSNPKWKSKSTKLLNDIDYEVIPSTQNCSPNESDIIIHFSNKELTALQESTNVAPDRFTGRGLPDLLKYAHIRNRDALKEPESSASSSPIPCVSFYSLFPDAIEPNCIEKQRESVPSTPFTWDLSDIKLFKVLDNLNKEKYEGFTKDNLKVERNKKRSRAGELLFKRLENEQSSQIIDYKSLTNKFLPHAQISESNIKLETQHDEPNKPHMGTTESVQTVKKDETLLLENRIVKFNFLPHSETSQCNLKLETQHDEPIKPDIRIIESVKTVKKDEKLFLKNRIVKNDMEKEMFRKAPDFAEKSIVLLQIFERLSVKRKTLEERSSLIRRYILDTS